MIHICHVITGLDVGGAERCLITVAGGLDPRRFSSDIVSLLESGPMAEEARSAGIPVVSLGLRNGRPGASAVPRLFRHLQRSRPTILQTWLYHADLVGLCAGRLARTPHIVWNIRCSDMTSGDSSPWLRRKLQLLAWMSRFPDALIVNSRQGRLAHENLSYRPRRWIEIPNAVDGLRFRPRPSERDELRRKLGLRPTAAVIGLVARAHPMKNHETFFRAAALLARESPHAEFVLCGEGCAEQFLNMAVSLGLEGRVHFLGTRLDSESVYPTFDVATLCSAYGEGCPNTLIEAMACGIPCVATDVGDSARILGSTGLIVPPGDAAALASAWAEMLAGDQRARSLQSRERALGQFNVENVLVHYEAVYLDLVARSACGQPLRSEVSCFDVRY
jgi:glycosyltransferase involved in cell wall biosynthesis